MRAWSKVGRISFLARGWAHQVAPLRISIPSPRVLVEVGVALEDRL